MIKVYQLTMPQNNFIVTIPFKGCQVKAQFKNGNVAKGINARLYTNDKFMQRALESNEMFGKTYKLVDTVKEPGDDEAEAQKPAAKQPAKPNKPSGKKSEKKAEQQEQKPADEQEPAQEKGAPEETSEGEGESGDNADDGSLSFDTTGEAIQYIAQKYNQQVKTKGAAIAFLAEQGVKAVIKK